MPRENREVASAGSPASAPQVQDAHKKAAIAGAVPAHTPGPWEWDAGLVPPDGPHRYADIYVNGGETIIAEFNDNIPEGRANARLIAAAPDMLEALKLIKRKLESDDPRLTLGDLAEVSLAIKKAEAK